MAYLKEHRLRAGLTQKQVADKLGLQAPAINKWESEATSPALRDLVRLAEVYSISPETLFVNPDDDVSRADTVSSIAALAKIAGVHPTAWIYIGGNTQRLKEAKEFSRIVTVFDRLPSALRKHWLVAGEAYPADGVGGDE